MPSADYTPTVEDVAALDHVRTASGGGEVGTFNDTTSPTGEEVERLIAFGVAEVESYIGTTIPEAFWTEAKRLAALYAVTQIEQSYFGHLIDTDRSPYRQAMASYLSGVQRLAERVRSPGSLRLV